MIEHLNLKRAGGRSINELIPEIEEKVNEIVDAMNALQNHYHSHGITCHLTSYPVYSKVSELRPGDGS